MIVQPDYFDHWKTRSLIELTGRPESPLWVLRLWAHCQSTRNWRFRDTPAIAIKSLCHVTSDITPEAWIKILIDCRFLDSDDAVLEVHGFREYNAGIIKNWLNGKRPKAKPTGSQREASVKPAGSKTQFGSSDRWIVDGGMEGSDQKKRKRANRPTDLAEVEAYVLAEGLSIAPDEIGKFFHHFNANGWYTGNRPLRDWTSALRKWILRAPEFAPRPVAGLKNSSGGPAASSAGEWIDESKLKIF